MKISCEGRPLRSSREGRYLSSPPNGMELKFDGLGASQYLPLGPFCKDRAKDKPSSVLSGRYHDHTQILIWVSLMTLMSVTRDIDIVYSSCNNIDVKASINLNLNLYHIDLIN